MANPNYDIEHSNPADTPLLLNPISTQDPKPGRPVRTFAGIIFFSVLCFATLIFTRQYYSGVVSEKSPETLFSDVSAGNYPWTNAMLSWQRTSFHFQPQNNFMSDPNGPLFHMGWYHIFYQYNPGSAVWGNITWGHSVSKDLVTWLYLPVAMFPDQWFDINGVFSGSATVLPDDQIVILYTGATAEDVQVQNLAYPANVSDPLLLDWVKHPNNPILVHPPRIGVKDFRDPTTAWVGPNGKWRIGIGSRVDTTTGIVLVYETTDFTNYTLLDGVLHSVPGTGMWECVDLYPVSLNGGNGLEMSVNGPDVKYVLKESSDEERHDYYAIGTFDPIENKWTPDDPDNDVGIGLRLDYGKYYASKTFYDHTQKRRILWGFTGETDTKEDDLLKGWASVITIPRTVVYDYKTGSNILQWPIKEIESLRSNSHEFKNVLLTPGSVVPLSVGSAAQLDITATFEVDQKSIENVVEADVGYNCTTSGGAASRGILGPFGILVLADQKLTEQTPVYFYIAKATDGTSRTYFCDDKSRSSLAPDVGKPISGSEVPVLHGEKLSVRILVDHSIVESFAQGGRSHPEYIRHEQ